MLRFREIATLAGAALILAACSSSKSNGTNKGNETGSGSTTTSTDGGAGSAGGGASTPGACDAYITYQQRCAESTEGKSQACADGRKQNCTGILATWSAEYQAAVAACETSATSCTDGPDACIDQHLSSMQPSAAQTKVRDDFCKSCTALADCTNAFFKFDADNGNGPGVTLLHASDPVADTIDKQCTGAALATHLDPDGGINDCVAAFSECVGEQQSSAMPNDPDACFPSGG